MRQSNVALRLQVSLLEEAKRVAASEGVALNQLINVAVAEKLSALRTEDYFRERAARAAFPKPSEFSNVQGKASSPLLEMNCNDRGGRLDLPLIYSSKECCG